MVIGYALKTKLEKSAKAFGRGLRVSRKDSKELCSAISGMSLDNGKRFLQELMEQNRSLGGKYYTSAAKGVMEILQSAENNAEFKGLDPERLFIHASAHKAFTFWRPRRFKLRRQKRKTTHIQVVLEQR